MIENKNLPVPMKYCKPIIMKIVIYSPRKNRPGKNSTRTLYYLPENGLWYLEYRLKDCFKSKLKCLHNMTYDEWENHWFLNDSELYSLDWSYRVVEYRYHQKPLYTKEYIRKKLMEDHDYKCDFAILKEDLPGLYKNSRTKFSIDFDYSLVPRFIGSYLEKIQLKYLINGKEKIYNTNLYSLITRKKDPYDYRAKKSGIMSRLGNDIFIEKSKHIHKDRYNYDRVNYINNFTPVQIRCNVCGHYFWMRPYDHLSGKGCIRCNGYSHGNLFTSDWLFDNNIDYESEYEVKDIKKNKGPVRIDFRFEKDNKEYWIEYNGRQHYEFVNRFHKDLESFEIQLKRDIKVKEYCLLHNIILIEIPYIIHSKDDIFSFLNKTILYNIDPNSLVDYNSLYKLPD